MVLSHQFASPAQGASRIKSIHLESGIRRTEALRGAPFTSLQGLPRTEWLHRRQRVIQSSESTSVELRPESSTRGLHRGELPLPGPNAVEFVGRRLQMRWGPVHCALNDPQDKVVSERGQGTFKQLAAPWCCRQRRTVCGTNESDHFPTACCPKRQRLCPDRAAANGCISEV